MATYSDEALILRTTKLGEADRIITLLTPYHGKIRAVAKGVRKMKSRFGARLEPFMRDSLLLADGKTFDIISQVVVKNSYTQQLISDYTLFVAATTIAETVDKLLPTEHEPHKEQYDLAVGAIAALAAHRHEPWKIVESYLLRSFQLAGWRPELYQCIVCGKVAEIEGELSYRVQPSFEYDDNNKYDDNNEDKENNGKSNGKKETQEYKRRLVLPTSTSPFTSSSSFYFSSPSGGLVCAVDRVPGSIPLKLEDIALLRALLKGEWKEVDRLATVYGNSVTVKKIIENWVHYYLERPLRSTRLLNSTI